MRIPTIVALLALATGPAIAQQIDSGDRAFLLTAATADTAEIQLGQIAEHRATTPKIRQFAQLMAQDHTKTNQALQRIAQQQHLPMPQGLDAAHLAIADRLNNLTGPAFNDAYMRDMVQDHRQNVADYKREADAGQDPALKRFARSYIPMLERHLELAEALARPI